MGQAGPPSLSLRFLERQGGDFVRESRLAIGVWPGEGGPSLRGFRKGESWTPNLKIKTAESNTRHYCMNSAGRPVRRSIRFAIGGWVENKLPKFIPRNGWIIKRCAVDGVASIGTRFEYASSFDNALASA